MINEIKKSFSENKLAIYASIAIFLFSFIFGFAFKQYLNSILTPVVEDLSQKVQTGEIRLTFVDIFSNNIGIVLKMFIYGLTFCFSAIVLAYNGFFVGFYIASSNNLFYTLLLILPHGIFEFSSCILACAGGFVLFNFLYRFLKSLWGQEDESLKKCFKAAFDDSSDKLKQAFILLIIASILMAIAAVIEVYLTIPLAKLIVSIL